MEGRVCVVRSHSELSAIDKELLNHLCRGADIYILKDTHITNCGGDRARFNTLIRNNDRWLRIIFITVDMIEQLKIVESTYYEESRRNYYPVPGDPLEKFNWHCPTCSKAFYDM